jgi:multicomponent Na+:H+ antiporter subunit C
MTMVVLNYAMAGVLLFSIGLGGLFFCGHVLRKILAVNVAGSGLFLVLVALARRPVDAPPDPVPHALVLTGIVVAVSATAVALTVYRRLENTADAAESKEGPLG